MSRYVDDMRNALRGYQGRVQAARARVDEMREAYGQEAADRQREREAERLKGERATAEAAIREAYSEGIYQVNQWGQLDGGRLTDDAKLLDADLVTPAQFDAMKAKYEGNFTMLAVLKKYGDRQNANAIQAARDMGDHAGAWGVAPYNVRDIPTKEGKLETWEGLRQNALKMLDMIDSSGAYGTDPYMAAFGNAMGGAAVENFGQGADV